MPDHHDVRFEQLHLPRDLHQRLILGHMFPVWLIVAEIDDLKLDDMGKRGDGFFSPNAAGCFFVGYIVWFCSFVMFRLTLRNR